MARIRLTIRHRRWAQVYLLALRALAVSRQSAFRERLISAVDFFAYWTK